MHISHLLTISAVLELATGVGLVLFPDAIATLLFSQDLYGAGVVVGRIAGIALIALGLSVWGGRTNQSNDTIAIAMLCYNGLVALYLATVGIANGLAGILLWPAVVIHTALACAQIWSKRQLDSH